MYALVNLARAHATIIVAVLLSTRKQVIEALATAPGVPQHTRDGRFFLSGSGPSVMLQLYTSSRGIRADTNSFYKVATTVRRYSWAFTLLPRTQASSSAYPPCNEPLSPYASVPNA